MEILPHWQFIYTISLDYPNQPDYQEVQNYKEFFVVLQYVIPCFQYRKHYVTYLATHPADYVLDNRMTLLHWVINLHPQHTPLKQLSKSSMNKIIWQYLHQICSHYPPNPTFQEVLFYKNFFLTLQNVLPKGCYRRKYVQQFNQIPIDRYMSSRQQMVNWIIMLNKRIDVNINYVVEHFTDYDTVILTTSIMLIIGVIVYYQLTRH